MFNIFKKKGKNIIKRGTETVTFEELSKSVQDYISNTNKYKSLKNEELSVIPDGELIDAVMTWMHNKINYNWQDEYNIIDSLEKPYKFVYACHSFFNEVENGGFNQLFNIFIYARNH